MWRWFWRIIGLAAVILSATACLFLYTLWKASALVPVSAGRPIDGRLDVVSLQIDILSLILAAVAIGLGVIGLFGYQNIKDVALERARDAAANEARDVLQRIYGIKIDGNGPRTYLDSEIDGEARASAGMAAPEPRPEIFDPSSVSTQGATRATQEDQITGDDEPEGSHRDRR